MPRHCAASWHQAQVPFRHPFHCAGDLFEGVVTFLWFICPFCIAHGLQGGKGVSFPTYVFGFPWASRLFWGFLVFLNLDSSFPTYKARIAASGHRGWWWDEPAAVSPLPSGSGSFFSLCFPFIRWSSPLASEPRRSIVGRSCVAVGLCFRAVIYGYTASLHSRGSNAVAETTLLFDSF